MYIDIVFVENLTKQIKHKMLSILIESDDDFYPSLSSKRKSMLSKKQKIKKYLKEKEDLPHLLIYYNKILIGFSNFINKYLFFYDDKLYEVNYIDTTCIKKEYRNKSIGHCITHYYENHLPNEYKSNYIVRETWSLNTAQLHLFKKHHYKEVKKVRLDKDSNGEYVYSCIFFKKVK